MEFYMALNCNPNNSIKDQYLCKIKPIVEKYNAQNFPLSYKQACSVYERLSKSTFLSILGYAPYKRPVSYVQDSFYFYKGQKTITTTADETYSLNLTRSYFEKLDEKGIIWRITSFNSKTRKVCVEIESQSGNRQLSITLPEIVSKQNEL